MSPVRDATAMPTEPQPLPVTKVISITNSNFLIQHSMVNIITIQRSLFTTQEMYYSQFSGESQSGAENYYHKKFIRLSKGCW